ncbi:uncharacterized protein LOC144440417 [Glandiceps talaboti]
MASPLSVARIPHLLGYLKYYSPVSNPLYYMLWNSVKTRNIWPNIQVSMDTSDLEKFTSVVCTANNYHDSPFEKSYFIHTTNNEKLKTLLEWPNVIDWEREMIMFETVPFSTFLVVDEMCRKRGYELVCEEKCHLLTLQDIKKAREIAQTQLPNGLQLCKLKTHHAPLLEEKWWTVNETAPPKFSEALQHCTTSAVYDERNKVFASWAVLKEYGDIGSVYTLPQYRGNNLGSIVTATVAMEIIKYGETPYVIVIDGNTSSYGMMERLGFQPHTDMTAWWVYQKTDK